MFLYYMYKASLNVVVVVVVLYEAGLDVVVPHVDVDGVVGHFHLNKNCILRDHVN